MSFMLSVTTDVSDSVKDVSVNWGDGETTDLGPGNHAVASHSYSKAGVFVLTPSVDTSAGRHATFSIRLTVGQ